MAIPRRHSLWRHPDFLKLWAGQSVSLLGSQFTTLALPLTAALTLRATPAEMGVLSALNFAPALLFGLPAGVWLDRSRRRPTLVAASLVSGLALATIPAAALLHILRLQQLYAVAFVAGTAAALFRVAYRAYVPGLVGRARLIEANSRLETSTMGASLIGPGLAGAAVQALTAPLAIAIDAVSFFACAVTIQLIRRDEPPPVVRGHPQPLREAREGLAEMWRQPLTRATLLTIATLNLFAFAMFTGYFLLYARELRVPAYVIGGIFAAGGASSIVGAQLSRPLADRWGLGPVTGAALACYTGGLLVIALAQGPQWLLIGMLLVGQVVSSVGVMAININLISVRQAVTPDRLQGRVNAAFLVVIWGAQTAGALVGGTLGQLLGIRQAMIIGAAGTGLGMAWLLSSPLLALSRPPGGDEAQPGAAEA